MIPKLISALSLLFAALVVINLRSLWQGVQGILTRKKER